MEAQSLAVKRAQVEFHNFASMGQLDVVLADYAGDNERRGGILAKYRDFIGDMTPFLEIGANAGHSSYMLANRFQADGFALDISADALRHGMFLMDAWRLSRAPVRVAGDALNLPFADNSLRFVMTCQTLSQFMDIEQVFVEVKRVLQPGGVWFFTEEPIKRILTLGLFRTPYEEQMKPWEKWLHEAGLLGYLASDVIGAHQEEGFGIRQNHTMHLKKWHGLIQKHFADARYEIFPHKRGWGEKMLHALPGINTWRSAKLLGGTLAVLARKAGESPAARGFTAFESFLKCPDCGSAMRREGDHLLACTRCAYQSPNEGGVFNLLRSEDKKELYPGRRADIVDFSEPGHDAQLTHGWHDLEGAFGNRYRWAEEHAGVRLERVHAGPLKLRIRGHAPKPGCKVEVKANGEVIERATLDRNGLFVLELPLPDAERYNIQLHTTPVWNAPGDNRELTVNYSLIRLIPA